MSDPTGGTPSIVPSNCRFGTAYDPRTRWPRLTRAIAVYIAGPRPTPDDLADAAETIGDYEVWRANWPSDSVTIHLRSIIRKARTV